MKNWILIVGLWGGLVAHVSAQSYIIVKLAPKQGLFFYERTKFLYPNRQFHYHFSGGDAFKTETVVVSDKSPSVLIFQQEPADMIPIFLFPQDTLIVRVSMLGKLMFEGKRVKEWEMMKDVVKQQSFTEPYFMNVNFRSWKDAEMYLDSVKRDSKVQIAQLRQEGGFSKEFMNYLQKERSYQWMASWLRHRNKSFRELPLSKELTQIKSELLADSLNVGSMFRIPALYGLVELECGCYKKDTFADSEEFAALFKYVMAHYKGNLRTQLLLVLLYEQIAITPNYASNKSFYQPYLDDFYGSNTDSDYADYIKLRLEEANSPRRRE
ncbi:hypothetical protein [Runella zeae]|uniref:hypothetical protein n=1 Tax=Runella zeae TaxID=94255 RepID=UPI00048D83AD|nr:hypothetical protein [Runella zeae]